MAAHLKENLQLAYDTVRTHKLRSGLTILGVFVGTVTLMAIGSILAGMNRTVVDQVRGFGTDTVFVYKFDPGFHGQLTREERMRKPISERDIAAVRDECTACTAISSQVFTGFANFGTSDDAHYRGHDVSPINLDGATPNYPVVLNQDIAAGRYFDEFENDHRENVCVLGNSVATALFTDGQQGIGKTIQIDGMDFRVVGVLAKLKMAGGGQNIEVQIPYNTYRKIYPAARDHFFAAAARPGMLQDAVDQIRSALRRSRGDKWNAPDSFGIATADSIIHQFHDLTSKVALAIVIIASIGMLIGGVGVMNIMLVSVTERTREIGVRKAIGARRRDITLQFLSEAVFLTGAGGVIGIIGGWLISLLIEVALPTLPSSVPLWAVIAGFSLSVGVGVFFGIVPAVKAAKLDPVEALRYE